MKTFFTLLLTSTLSISAFALTSPFQSINCQYTQTERVMVQLNLGAFGDYAVFRSASMTAPERTTILNQFETPMDLELDGYMPTPWPQGTSFRITLSKNSPFHDIVIDNPKGSFERLTMTCNGQW